METLISIEEIKELVKFSKIHDCDITKHRVIWPNRDELQKLVDEIGENIEVHPLISELNFVDLVLTCDKVTLFHTIAECYESFELRQRGKDVSTEAPF